MQAGSFFMAGIKGLMPDEKVRSLILEHNLFGVVLFSRNFESSDQLKELTFKLQQLKRETSDTPLVIAGDFEGGFVSRFPHAVKTLPAAFAFGIANCFDWTRDLYHIQGIELKELGINVNFAPVLDIHPKMGNDSAIGIRSFGRDKEIVTKGALAALEGLSRAGVIACGKHFPGLGQVVLDSHDILPEFDNWEYENLEPFKALIHENLKMFMSAHCIYPQLEELKIPATFSYKINTGLLRKKLNFEGVLISDDLGMGAIVKNWNMKEAIIGALSSGVDVSLVCHFEGEWDPLLREIRRELLRIDQDILEKSYARKKKFLKFLKQISVKENEINEYKFREICEKIARRSFTALKKEVFSLHRREKIALLTTKFFASEVEEDFHHPAGFFRNFQILFPESVVFTEESLGSYSPKVFEKTIIIGCDFKRRGWENSLFKDKLSQISPQEVMTVCVKNEADAFIAMPFCDTILLTYGWSKENQDVLLNYLSNELTKGRI